MPPLTDQVALLENFELQLIQQGSVGGWQVGKAIYLQCPRCHYYVSTTEYDQCECSCITIDVDYGRISVRGEAESNIATSRAIPKIV